MCKAVQVEDKLPRFTREEISTKRQDLVIIEDEVYNAEKFRWVHPGGALFVAVFGGRDATLAFQSYHMRAFPREKMQEYLVGKLESTEKVVRPDPEHTELTKLLKPVLTKGSFAPTSQIVKAGLIFVAAVTVELYLLLVQRTWLGSLILGLLFAGIGLNIQHDANHGAMFKNGKLNVFCGLAQAWIGGSQLMWVQEHVVLHHVHTGDVDMDPDAQLAPALRGHGGSVWFPWMRLQHLYFVLAELGYGVVPLFVALLETLTWRHKFDSKYKLSRLALPWGVQSVLLHLGFYARFFLAPCYLATQNAAASERNAILMVTIAKLSLTVMAGGGYLAFFFFLSHNFDGVQFVEGAKPTGECDYPKGSSFLRQQAASSSNVGGPKLCFANGGLNYQIEHHLFPRIAHSHYPIIAPIVKEFCAKRKIPYAHFDTVSSNFLSVVAYLKKTGDPLFDVPHLKPE